MRVVAVALLLIGCGKDDPSTDAADTASSETAEAAECSSWQDFACSGSALFCVSSCGEILDIQCNARQCSLQGRGQGGGRSCTISVGDRQMACGLCETAFEECL